MPTHAIAAPHATYYHSRHSSDADCCAEETANHTPGRPHHALAGRDARAPHGSVGSVGHRRPRSQLMLSSSASPLQVCRINNLLSCVTWQKRMPLDTATLGAHAPWSTTLWRCGISLSIRLLADRSMPLSRLWRAQTLHLLRPSAALHCISSTRTHCRSDRQLIAGAATRRILFALRWSRRSRLSCSSIDAWRK